MNQQPQTEMTPEDQALFQAAGEAESNAANEALVGHLQARVVFLHVEVKRRDSRIAELETELAAVSEKGSGDQPT